MKAVLFFGTLILAGNVFALDTGATVKVNGMVCSFCTSSIEKKFKENKEVAAVNVDLDTKTVVLKYNSNQELKEEQIKDIVAKAGYTVVSIEHLVAAAAVPGTTETPSSEKAAIPKPAKKIAF